MTANEAIGNKERESETLDYKRQTPENIHYHIAAMANTNGGTIVIGVEEDKGIPTNIVGVVDADAEERKIREKIHASVSPTLHPVIQSEKHGDPAVTLLTVRVQKSEQTHMVWNNRTNNGDIYRRSGPASLPLNREQLTELINRTTKVIRHYCIETTADKLVYPVELDAETQRQVIEGTFPQLGRISYRTRFGDKKEIATGEVRGVVPLDRTAKFVLEHHNNNNYVVSLRHENGSDERKGARTLDEALDKMEEITKEKARNGVYIGREYTTEDVPPKPKSILVPELHPQAVDNRPGAPAYAACVYIFNTSDHLSAKDVRVVIGHTEVHSICAFRESDEWKSAADGRLNPRTLESSKPIHAQERRGTFSIQFPDDCPDELIFSVEIRCLDQPTTQWKLVAPKKRLKKLDFIPFVQMP